MNRLAFKLEFARAGDHRHVKVFTGTDGETLALAGRLVLREAEFEQFAAALLVGASVIQAKPHVRVDPARPPRAFSEVSHG